MLWKIKKVKRIRTSDGYEGGVTVVWPHLWAVVALKIKITYVFF